MTDYDALVVVSFGGPEGPGDVMPFLENVTRGRGIPRARLEAVAEHYLRFGGVSPINQQCRELIKTLEPLVEAPIYWGNRNWHPLLEDTVRAMAADGVRSAAAFITSAYSSASSCRQYLDDIAVARRAVPGAPEIVRLRHFHDHPGFITAMTDRVTAAIDEVPGPPHLVFTAHSIPEPMAQAAGPYGGAYESELAVAAERVARAAGVADWSLAWQSRSGPPSQPWLEPDICDHLETLAGRGVRDVVVVPIGFVSDHMEVVYDLDHEAAAKAEELGLHFARAGTAGTHPRFVEMVAEQFAGGDVRKCPETCCIMTK